MCNLGSKFKQNLQEQIISINDNLSEMCPVMLDNSNIPSYLLSINQLGGFLRVF